VRNGEDANLLRRKPRRDDFHTSSGNHFIAKLFQAEV